ncbi:hypothetical protein BKA70DRAFT_1556222 [Coprinopsis sp. MPI-PUGE-AT-0042]|nr:hypothetical protein BKA70DRAFT_1577280 [Coprinopsis sp. MPI-PUGE-AT-0042]KAH6915602.1 hypothetical protein BKA70DRAFT_1556222 [Coprinopsis sp. MPI-PUGE-AT-0042]
MDNLPERLPEQTTDKDADICNALSPIRQLSDDLLREVFVRCLPSQRTFDSTEAPLLLCHICHHWRALATDHSLLGTSLKLNLRQSDTRYNLRQELVSSWLARCKGSQVSLQVISLLLVGELQDEPLSPKHFTFLNNLVTHPPLCYFSCLVLYRVPVQVIHSCLPGALPSLENLVLSFYFKDEPEWDEIGPISVFRDCPFLRRVALSGYCLINTSIDQVISIAWQQLTHFLCDDALQPSFYSARLPQMNNLLQSYFMMGNENVGASGPDISQVAPRSAINILDTLVSLTICYWDTRFAVVTHPNMWWDFDFPSIQNLRLRAFDFDFSEDTDWGELRLRSFTNKLESMKKIKSLSLCVTRLSHNTCTAVFERLPQLAALDLETCDQYQHVLEVLTYIPGRNLLPCLREVVFEVGHIDGYDALRENALEDDDIIDTRRLEDMVKSRWRRETERRLQRVVFYAAKQQQLHEKKPFVECLRRYEKEGLEVVLICEEGTGHREVDHHWSQRDKNLQGWPETGVVFNSYYESSS